MLIRFLLFYKAGTVRSVSATYNNFKINWWNERKSYLVVSALNSRLDGRWRPILDGNGENKTCYPFTMESKRALPDVFLNTNNPIISEVLRRIINI